MSAHNRITGLIPADAQADNLKQFFRTLQIVPAHCEHAKPTERKRPIVCAQADLMASTECDGFIAFPVPSAIGKSYADALSRLWDIHRGKHRIESVPHQSAGAPVLASYHEPYANFFQNGYGMRYGDICVAPIQLSKFRNKGAMQALGEVERSDMEEPVGLYEILCLLLGAPELSDQIKTGKLVLRFLEGYRKSLNPADHLLPWRRGAKVPRFNIITHRSEDKNLVLAGEPSPTFVHPEGRGAGLVTRFRTGFRGDLVNIEPPKDSNS